MIITVNDHRHEDRHRDTIRDLDGTILTDDELRARRVWTQRSTQATEVQDTRSVTVRFEDADWADGGIPRSLDRAADRNVSGTFVNRMDIKFVRSVDNDGYSKGGRWRRTMITVSGPNRKKDGNPGEKPQRIHFPTRTWTKVGVWTEADIDPDKDPDSYWGRQQRERVGQDKHDHVSDPLPDWVQSIVDRVHPGTGALPFRWTSAHLFGDFADQSWTPEVGVERVGGPVADRLKNGEDAQVFRARLDDMVCWPSVIESRRRFSEKQRKCVAYYVGAMIDTDGLTPDEVTERALLAADLALYGTIVAIDGHHRAQDTEQDLSQ